MRTSLGARTSEVRTRLYSPKGNTIFVAQQSKVVAGSGWTDDAAGIIVNVVESNVATMRSI